jgi:hypothetical protein
MRCQTRAKSPDSCVREAFFNSKVQIIEVPNASKLVKSVSWDTKVHIRLIPARSLIKSIEITPATRASERSETRATEFRNAWLEYKYSKFYSQKYTCDAKQEQIRQISLLGRKSSNYRNPKREQTRQISLLGHKSSY